MEEYRKILNQYWGFSRFRPLQEEIVESVMNGQDTLALMPTGGGKSITFQVPAMARPGICIVVTPLISLMRDQVETLKSKNIKAVAIHSGLSSFELDIALDNCIYGDYKFLYLSPERLSSPLFRTRLESMRVNLIAVDEAHCISQWGYDFRPSYLKIAELRTLLPGVPILALTATATKDVAIDIQKSLKFPSENIIRQSFERKNLVYWVTQAEDKNLYLLRSLRQQVGSAIVYVRSRKKTREIAEFLRSEQISADYYHAGLGSAIRVIKEQNWQRGNIRVMVSTNAFGMGIDKSNVRIVIHYDLPDSPEAYFQEAGRAGRDGKKAFAILLYHPSDKKSLNQSLTIRFPDIDVLRKVYHSLGNYFQLVPGSGKGQVFDFNLRDFSNKFEFHTLTVYHSIKHLERAGYLELTDEIDLPSRLYFRVNRDDLYRFQVKNSQYDGIIRLLLRIYSGMFSEFVYINEELIAQKAGTKIQMIERVLQNLHNNAIIYYIKPTKSPRIIFTTEKLEEKSLLLPLENYAWRQTEAIKRLETMFEYAESELRCRSKILLMYFGERDPFDCGHCDFCRHNEVTDEMAKPISQADILNVLKGKPMEIKALMFALNADEKKLVMLINELLDEGAIDEKDGLLSIK